MNERCELKRYADNLSCILNMGSVATVSERPMEANEQGFSGAELMRLDAVFDDGRQGSFICKKADLKERISGQRSDILVLFICFRVLCNGRMDRKNDC